MTLIDAARAAVADYFGDADPDPTDGRLGTRLFDTMIALREAIRREEEAAKKPMRCSCPCCVVYGPPPVDLQKIYEEGKRVVEEMERKHGPLPKIRLEPDHDTE